MKWILVCLILFLSQLCPAKLRADLNGDCRVDFADLHILMSEWMQEEECMALPNQVIVQGATNPVGVNGLILTKIADSNGDPAWGYNVNNDASPLSYPYCVLIRDVTDSFYVLQYVITDDAPNYYFWSNETDDISFPVSLEPLEIEGYGVSTGTATATGYTEPEGGIMSDLGQELWSW
jgi:hypothetical protein